MLDTTSATTVLFLDMLEVENLHNAELVVNQAEKCPANPVLPLGDVGEWDLAMAAPWSGTVLFDEEEQVFKVWYKGVTGKEDGDPHLGYAWSEDGIYWHKPRLGLYEYNGSRENNIVFQSLTGMDVYGVRKPHRAGHFVIAKDVMEPNPARRYKGWTCMYHEPQNTNCHFPVYSPDGIHWTVGSEPVRYPTGDPGNMIFDDDDPDPGKRVKIYGNVGSIRWTGHIDMGYGPDIEHCIPSPHNPVIDSKDGLEHTVHLFSGIHYGEYYVVLYDYNVWQDYYGLKGDVAMRARDGRVPEPKTGAFIGDIRLAVNRDGISKFQRVNPHQPLVARGKKGEWDSSSLHLPGAVVCGDTIYIFYSGVDEAGGALPNILLPSTSAVVRMGLATLRRDGFTYLQSRDGLAPATVTTVPIRVVKPERARLEVNASHLIPYWDWIEVEVLDAATGQPTAGYRREECADLMQEGIRIPVRWGDNETLARIEVPEIQLRFHLYGKARLYSYTLVPAEPRGET